MSVYPGFEYNHSMRHRLIKRVCCVQSLRLFITGPNLYKSVSPFPSSEAHCMIIHIPPTSIINHGLPSLNLHYRTRTNILLHPYHASSPQHSIHSLPTRLPLHLARLASSDLLLRIKGLWNPSSGLAWVRGDVEAE
jgi:hypothetical protein